MEKAKIEDLTSWVDAYTSDLYNWAMQKVSNAELAKDLVQDTFLAAAEKISNFKGDSTPKTWLFAILNHKIIDIYRKKVNQPVQMENQSLSTFFDEHGSWKPELMPKTWDEEEQLLDNDEFQEILKKCLDALPDKWSACVKLKYIVNKKGEDICQELNIAPTNYWQIMHRAKLQLRNCVEENWYKN